MRTFIKRTTLFFLLVISTASLTGCFVRADDGGRDRDHGSLDHHDDHDHGDHDHGDFEHDHH